MSWYCIFRGRKSKLVFFDFWCVCVCVWFSNMHIKVILYCSLIFSICLVLQQLKSPLPRSPSSYTLNMTVLQQLRVCCVTHTTANPAEPTQSSVLADYCSRHGLLLSRALCSHTETLKTHTCMCTCACTHTCTHTHTDTCARTQWIVNRLKWECFLYDIFRKVCT